MERLVVKVGGSLLGDPDFGDCARQWLSTESGRACVFVVGCGALADALCSVDAAHKLDAAFCHWSCITLMDLTADLFAQVAGIEVTADWNRLQADLRRGQRRVLRPSGFLRELERRLPGPPLPVGWHVTSDSIAARIAVLLGAELVLWKSATPAAVELAALADSGFVDRYFPTAAADLAVRVVNLAQEPWEETRIR